MPVKGFRVVVLAFFAGMACSYRCMGLQLSQLFVGTGHAREGFSAVVLAFFAGMARSYSCTGLQLSQLFVGTGHARERFSAEGIALFAGMACSYRRVLVSVINCAVFTLPGIPMFTATLLVHLSADRHG